MSLFGMVRLGSSVAVLDFACVGSALSVRSMSRLGSSLSLFGGLIMGASLSVFDFATVGSSLSLRSFSRFGSSMAIFSTFQLAGDLQFTTADKGIYSRNSDGTTTKRITFPDGTVGAGYEGHLHGTWESEGVVTSSDRRLKRDITPLHQTLLSRMSTVKGTTGEGLDASSSSGSGSGTGTGAKKKTRQEAVDWVLRELRPVSFTFRKGVDSKSMQGKHRYGFVAQEVEKVVPDLVRDIGATKTMMYNDLIAMITVAAQDHQERLDQHHGEVGKLRSLLKRLAEKLGHLQKRVKRVIGPLEPRAGLRGVGKTSQR